MNEKTIYALGFFDGVHLGHAALLTACRRLAAARGWKAGVVTFSDHPDTLVLGRTPPLICTVQDRERLLREDFCMDTVVTLPFDGAMKAMPWQDFLRLLAREYGAAGFVCGTDFRFGCRGEGTAALLREVCRAREIPCAVVPQLKVDGQVVSSTCIRGLIAAGEMETAVRFLGHPYVLTGRVVHGCRIGRTLGIPTANLRLPQELATPRFGVYICRTVIDGTAYPAVTNIGTRPTVHGQGVTVEPWILDFEGDLYDREIRLEFHRFLRPEMKFPDTAALQREIRKNAGETRAFFAEKESLNETGSAK